MHKALILLLFRLFPITLIAPAGFIVLAIVIGFLVGSLGIFVDGCNGFYSCYWAPFKNWAESEKTWRLLVLLWVIGLVAVYWNLYRRLKSKQ